MHPIARRTKKMRRLPLLLIPVLLGFAMAPAEENAPDAQVTVDLTARQLQSTPEEDFARAVGAADRIKVEGAMTTPTPCYDLVGQLRRDGAALTLTVEARRKEGGCIQVIAAFGYDAAVRGLPPGRYTLRVLHAYPGTGWEGKTAAETEVEVG
jgi:hypothetical protein